MRIWRRTGIAGAWSLATGLGAVIVWVGLHPVLDAAVPDRSSALSAADARRMVAPTKAPVPTMPSLPPSMSPRGHGPAASRSPVGGRSAPAVAATGSPSVVAGWTVTTKPDGTVTYTRSFRVAGGDAVIGMTPGRVYLISATPRSPYTVQTSQPSATRLVVQFLNGNLANLIDAIWWNGAPYSQVT